MRIICTTSAAVVALVLVLITTLLQIQIQFQVVSSFTAISTATSPAARQKLHLLHTKQHDHQPSSSLLSLSRRRRVLLPPPVVLLVVRRQTASGHHHCHRLRMMMHQNKDHHHEDIDYYCDDDGNGGSSNAEGNNNNDHHHQDGDLIMNLDATELSSMIRKGQLSAVQLMNMTLDRIDKINPHVNAIIMLRDRSELLNEASMVDAEMRQERVGGFEGSSIQQPLRGIPMAIKDLSDVEGIPTTMGGCPLFDNFVPTKSDPYVQRLQQQAGAIVIGKTNTPELGLGAHTFNQKWGSTRNVFDLTKTSGGSSGGAGASVASGMLPVADGTDTMGSLRNPAGWNNLYSIRPTAGLIKASDKDAIDKGNKNPLQYPYSTPGVIAKSVRDLKMMLPIMIGDDSDNAEELLQPPQPSPTLYRIGWLGDWCKHYPIENGIVHLCKSALDEFEQQTATIIEVVDITKQPPIYDASKIWKSITTIRSSIFTNDMMNSDLFSVDDLLSPASSSTTGKNNNTSGVRSTIQWEVTRGISTTDEALQEAIDIAEEWSSTVQEHVFRDYDVIALPSAQVWPFDIDENKLYPTKINGVPMDSYHKWMEIYAPASLAGLPVVTIPAGFGHTSSNSSSSSLLPMGIQLIGQRYDDTKLLQIAQLYHENVFEKNRQQDGPKPLASLR